MPDHPDREQLAAFQAGDGDRRQRTDVEAHLAGCPSCAEVVASVELARGRLALLEEPELPPGLHDRLAAAVADEAAQAAADRPASRFRPAAEEAVRRPASRSRRRGAPAPHAPIPWYRRPVAWGAAAALLLVALVVPFLDRSESQLTTAGGGAGGAQEAAAPGQAADADRLPLIRVPGEVSVATVRSRLAADGRAKAALDAAAGGQPAAPEAPPSPTAPGAQDEAAPPAPGAPGQAAPTTPDAQGQAPSTASGARDQGDAYRSSGSRAGTTGLDACLPAATAFAEPATRPLAPAFFIEGTWHGRDATVLVTTSTGEPGRVDLWVFPRGDCSSPPLTGERVR